MDKPFEEVVAAVIRERVVRGDEVVLKGVGSFRKEHRNQYQKQFEDGRVVLMPPRDTIIFTPDPRGA